MLPQSFLAFLFCFTFLNTAQCLSPHNLANQPAPAFPLPEYEAQYEISWHGIPAGDSIHRLIKKENAIYYFDIKTTPRLRILPYQYHENSVFLWKESQILPQRYYYKIFEGKRKKEGIVIFDWKKNTLYNQLVSPSWETPIIDGIQDKITQTLALRKILLEQKNDFHFFVAEEDKIKEYQFMLLGEEILKTKLGPLLTLKVEHTSRKGAITHLWLAKKWAYLPVKMIQNRHGKAVASGEITHYTPFKE